MKIREVTFKEYQCLVINPFTIFDSAEFTELNKAKTTDVKYLIFNDGKDRVGLIAGVQDKILKAPFSSPFSCFSLISHNLKISVYLNAVASLVAYAKDAGVVKVMLTLPPMPYDEDHISKICNALYVNGFEIAGSDLNYQYDLNKFSDQYEMSIDVKARQKLRSSIKNNLVFSKTDDIDTVYSIIKENRELKGYPLRMSRLDVIKTADVVDIDYFLVSDELNEGVASAIVYHVTDGKIQVVYWGNLVASNQLKPMNYLAFKMFEYYKRLDFSFFDAGPSTEFSIPNTGLCDFKQGIGCMASPKFSFELNIDHG